MEHTSGDQDSHVIWAPDVQLDCQSPDLEPQRIAMPCNMSTSDHLWISAAVYGVAEGF